MSAAGLAQIALYLVVLTALAVPLGRYMAGVFARRSRHSLLELVVVGIAVAVAAEVHGSPVLRASGVDNNAGNMADKELRFGAGGSALSIATDAGRASIFNPGPHGFVAVLALAGSLAGKRASPATAGTLRTDTVTFGVLLVGVTVVLAGLAILPALVLGPIVEGLAG